MADYIPVDHDPFNDDLFGFSIRQKLYPGEDKFFKDNPTVSGMASESGHIILNPYSPADVNKDAVARNEAFRLHLRKQNIVPDFQLTDEQRKNFSGTAYSTNDNDLKSTIAARIYSGDASAQPTAEQQNWVSSFLQTSKSPSFKPVDHDPFVGDE